MSQIPLVNAQLGAFVAETFLYGASFVLFIMAMYFIRRQTNSKNVDARPFSKPVFAALVIVIILNTAVSKGAYIKSTD